MSKSLGTGIDPIDLIEGGPRPPVFAQGNQPPGDFPAYGADAVRWGLLAMSSGQDVRFSEDKVAQGQQLTNKLWNAARLILLGVDGGGRRGAARRRCPRPSRTAGSCRGWSAPAPSCRPTSSASTSRTPRSASTTSSTASCATGTWSWSSRGCAPASPSCRRRSCTSSPRRSRSRIRSSRSRPRRSTPTSPAPRGCWRRACPAARRPRSTSPPRRPCSMRSTPSRSCGGWRDLAGVKAGAMLDARLEAPGYEDTIEHVSRLARLSLDGAAQRRRAGRGGAHPRRSGADLRRRRGRRRGRRGAQGRAARQARSRDRARRAQARQRRASWPRRRPEVVQAERDKLARLHAELEAL